jgi:hypothetical protein
MTNCLVIVQFPLPKRSEDQAISSGTSTAPIYRDLAGKGLISKHYLNGDTGTGGVYLWENRAAAEAWFTKERQEMLADKFGAKPEILFFDTHVVVDNQRGETRVNGQSLSDIQAAE